MAKKTIRQFDLDSIEVISRTDYQEILLAKMAGGDLYANEIRLKMRELDRKLDTIREKPIYNMNVKQS